MISHESSKHSLASFFHSYFSKEAKEQINLSPLVITPSFHTKKEKNILLPGFIHSISEVIFSIIPPEILERLKQTVSSYTFEESLTQLLELLPIVSFSTFHSHPSTTCATLLVSAHYTQGVGRYFTDSVSRWLIPGKFLPIYSSQALKFHFNASHNYPFFVYQITCPATDAHDAAQMQANAKGLAHEIRLNIIAVKQSRKILANNRLPAEHKRTLIEAGISTLLNRPAIESDTNVFDQMHHFLLKLAGEEKETAIKKRFSMIIDHKPILFDRDIFSEIRYFILLFRDRFTAIRTDRHITKTISILYFFRKALLSKLQTHPIERHFSFKIFKTQLTFPHDKKNVLSLLIGINVLQDNELLEKRHILAAIDHTLKGVRFVEHSFVVDRRPSEKIRLFYLEIEKNDGSSFTLKETMQLKKRLPRELKGRTENVLHPILLSRNEEEILRNIVMLSNELSYVQDIPQAYISFDGQIGNNLSFTVVLLRLLRKNDKPIKEILQLAHTPLTFLDFETKIVDHLRKKYPKESNVFRVELDKTPFLRKDFSLDLFKARIIVSEEISRILGEIRDVNGGMLSKQNEALISLKNALKGEERSNEFILENFFYSISPVISRTILYTSLLSSFYHMMLNALEKDFIHSKYAIDTRIDDEYFLIMISSPKEIFKNPILKALIPFNIPPLDLTTTYNNSTEIASLGIIHRCDNAKKNRHLLKTIHETMDQLIATSS